MLQELKDHVLYYRIHGSLVRVTAIADNDAEANAHMVANRGHSVLAVAGHMIIMASECDMGIKAPDDYAISVPPLSRRRR
jgi:hypothetical protein